MPDALLEVGDANMIMDKSFIFGEAHNLSHSEVNADTFPGFKKVKFRYSAIHLALLFMLMASSAPALAGTCIQMDEIGINSAQGPGTSYQATCGPFAIAIGAGTGATSDDYSIAIGDASRATSRNSIAFGRQTVAETQGATALGSQSKALAESATAVGQEAVVSSDAAFGTALGADSRVTAANGVAVGYQANASAINAISIGTRSKVTGENSGAMGNLSVVSGANSYALGNNSTVAADNVFTMGNNISVDAGLNGAIVLGNGSSARAAIATGSAEIDGNVYNFAGATPGAGSVLSIGAVGAERQITYVAAGQLNATSTDAVNGSQLFATNSAVNTLGTKVSQNIADITNLYGSVTDVQNLVNSGNIPVKYFSTGSASTGADSVASGLNSVAIGQAATATEEDSVAFGNAANAGFANSLALGANSVTTVGAQTGYSAYRLTAPQTSVGEVAFGTASGNRKLTGIAAGTNNNDAVNVEQLMAVGTQVDLNTTDISNLNNLVSAGNFSVKYFSTGSASTGADSVASGLNSVAIGQAATATEEDSVAFGNGANAGFANSLALGANSVTTVGAQTDYSAYRLTALQTSVGEVAFGTASGNRKLTGIAAGTNNNDAVNVEQLMAVGTQVDLNTTDISNLNNLVSAGNFSVKYFSTGSTGTGADSVASGLDSVAIGQAATATEEDSVAFGNGANAKFANSLALGANSATTVGAQTDYSAYRLTALQTSVGEVAFGTASGNRKLTVIAAGTNNNDAVNVEQLMAVGTQVDQNTTDITNLTGDVQNIVNNGGAVKFFSTGSASTGVNSIASGLDSVAIGQAATATEEDSVAFGNGANAKFANSLALGANSVTTVGAQTDYTAYRLTALQTSVGEVAFGTASGNRKLTGIAAGTNNNDAVNVEQLMAVGSQVDQNTTDITNLTGDVQNIVNNGGAVKFFSTGSASTGVNSIASGLDSVAIGQAAIATEEDSVAFGNGANAGFANSLALGANSVTTVGAQTDYTAYRLTAPQTSIGEVAFGTASGNRKLTGIAAGTNNNDAVNVEQLMAVGTQVDQNTTDITNLTGDVQNIVNNGGAVKFFSTGSASTGVNSIASGLDSVAIGQAATATEEDSVAFGNGANAGFANSLALGANSATTVGAQTDYTAYRLTALQTSVGEVAFGTASGNRKLTGIAAGSADNDAVNVAQLMAVGSQVDQNTTDITNLTGDVQNIVNNGGAVKFFSTGSASTGVNSIASGLDSVAIGQAATATEEDSVAFGNGANAKFANSLALGANSATTVGAQTDYSAYRLTALQSSVGEVAFGTASGNRKLTGIAAGTNNNDAVNVEQLMAVGSQVDQNTTDITNLTGDVQNIVNNGGAVKFFSTGSASTGVNSIASGLDSVAIGQAATATEEDSVAFGNGANAKFANSLALGANSATTVGAQTDYTAYRLTALQTSVGEVAFGTASGNRKLTGIAAGSADNDAVNVAQLMAVGSQVDQNTTDITNLTGDVQNIVNNGGAVKFFSTGSTSTGVNSIASGLDSVAIGQAATATEEDSVAFGNGANAKFANSLALGANSVTTQGAETGYSAYRLTAAQNSVGEVAFGTVSGNRKLTGIAAGTNNNDAVNVEQLMAVGSLVDKNTTDITNLTGDVQNIVNNGGAVKFFSTGSTSTGVNSIASGLDSVAIGQAATATEEDSVAFGNGANAKFANSLALGANSATTVGAQTDYTAYRLTALQTSVGEVAFGTASGNRKITGIAAGTNNNDAVNVEQLMAVGSQVDKNTSDISDLGSRITSIENNPGSGGSGSTKYFSANSTAGNSVATGTDAVAVGPSAQASGDGAIAMGSGAQAQADGSVALGKNSSDGNRGAESYTGKYSGASNNSVGTVSVGNSATGEVRTVSNIADGVQSNDAVNVRQLDGAVAQSKQYTDDSIANLETNAGTTNTRVAQLTMGTSGLFRVENAAGWDDAAASGKNSVAGGAAATATAKSSTALGTNAHATHENSVALGTNSVTERENSVSVGSVGNERQVTNVAAATRGTDAVNLTQLNRSMAEAGNYTDRRFNQLQDDMSKQDRRLSAGIASAMAMASLPQPYTPGASMISLGGASYRGQSGISFGLSHLSDDGRWVTKAQLNNNSQNNVGWGVGVGYQF